MKNLNKLLIFSLVLTAFLAMKVFAAPVSIPDGERVEGPFERLILRGVIVVNGEGATPTGPADVLVEGNRIAQIRNLGLYEPIPESDRIAVLPAFLDHTWFLLA